MDPKLQAKMDSKLRAAVCHRVGDFKQVTMKSDANGNATITVQEKDKIIVHIHKPDEVVKVHATVVELPLTTLKRMVDALWALEGHDA
jgi:hypothetical protein